MTALDAAYLTKRQRLSHTVTRHVAAVFAADHRNQPQTLAQIIPVVETGQRHSAGLAEAYMTAKAIQATDARLAVTIDPRSYTISALRGGASATDVYSRPFGALYKTLNGGADAAKALAVAQHSLAKLAATDLQLAQTHAAHDWMRQAAKKPGIHIVGYRRVLTGPGPHCTLCTLASTRTYHIADLMPIHEHCSCTVEPLWGTEPVSSVGTTVRVENDPELGPRLMADHWSPVGPRIALN